MSPASDVAVSQPPQNGLCIPAQFKEWFWYAEKRCLTVHILFPVFTQVCMYIDMHVVLIPDEVVSRGCIYSRRKA